MKKNLFLIAVMTLLTTASIYAQDYYWPLTSDLKDTKGSLDGIDHGVTFQNDAIRGNVALFNGEGYVNLPSFINGLSEMTVAVWFRMDVEQVWSRIYSFGSGDQTEPKDVMMVIPVGGNENMFRFTLSNPDGAWYDFDFTKEEVTIDLNTWYYSTVVLTASTVAIYINDVKIMEESIDRNFGTLTDTENALGKSFWPDALFKGAMSDLRVYKSAMTEEQVKALYIETKKDGSAVDTKAANNSTPNVRYIDGKIDIQLNQAMNHQTVNVYNVAGALVATQTIDNVSKIELNKGVYIVKISGTDMNYSTKLMIK